MDILQALSAEAPTNSPGKCKVGRWLDGIPEDAPGRGELVDAIESTNSRDSGFRTLEQAQRVMRRLDFDVSNKTLGEHRRGNCRCFD